MNFYIVKSADISYITLLQFSIAYVFATIIENVFASLFKVETENAYMLTLEILLQVMISSVLSYVGRNLMQIIPSPFDGINGFKHNLVKEFNSGPILLMFLITLQPRLQQKITKLRSFNFLNYEK